MFHRASASGSDTTNVPCLDVFETRLVSPVCFSFRIFSKPRTTCPALHFRMDLIADIEALPLDGLWSLANTRHLQLSRRTLLSLKVVDICWYLMLDMLSDLPNHTVSGPWAVLCAHLSLSLGLRPLPSTFGNRICVLKMAFNAPSPAVPRRRALLIVLRNHSKYQG